MCFLKQIPVNENNSKKIETWGELMTEMEKRNKKKQGELTEEEKLEVFME